ncbi:hypothetical protein LEP1GSC047_0950 [Leptospira inadai serovar Lyme str. 10]|uniref:Uncharacterized protein n=2 Tax=Leptospira inadai serovar Lyme TaxID=293084 RepID=V6HAJ6_9LEPT|nr:hypothetical protein [Leptospira inadai]EQA35418.1 hypothetical protein LEP1GSC047_0950 [Leptospira inadai serovar Lyme str. 10]PNV71506.1 hypothetical protein BES34_021465 [Leptospira inadai serovar Lyme]
MRKIIFWIGVLFSVSIPMTLPLAEAGACVNGDESMYLFFTEIACVISVFCLLAVSFGSATSGVLSLWLGSIPALLGAYFYIAYVPVYLYFSTFGNYGLCDILSQDLFIGKSNLTPAKEAFNGVFSRSFALLIAIPFSSLAVAPYKIYKASRF